VYTTYFLPDGFFRGYRRDDKVTVVASSRFEEFDEFYEYEMQLTNLHDAAAASTSAPAFSARKLLISLVPWPLTSLVRPNASSSLTAEQTSGAPYKTRTGVACRCSVARYFDVEGAYLEGKFAADVRSTLALYYSKKSQ